ncbi:thermonuclease family protein [Mycoplasma sp. OR1901]|uniref:thermonuclease family protein n=1 Tax=Mycoplasma sp. OR1901 TaxID=2742195 RepID=UPI0015838647|nr:thermonuclease family protein [Mycoplasma sp. OR1901]QKT05331.1 thermonuclease family protein [Mycoplasma sp. OR1901]
MLQKIPKKILIVIKILLVILTITIGIFISKNNYGNSNQKKLVELKINRVLDGDTIEGKINNKKVTIRFYGIDTPETLKENNKNKLANYENYYANIAKNVLTNKIDSEDKFYYMHFDTDEYGRDVGLIYFKNINNNDFKSTLNSLMVEKGLARVAYIQNSNFKQKYYTKNQIQKDFYSYIIGVEEKSKNEGNGFWNLELDQVFYKYKKMV